MVGKLSPYNICFTLEANLGKSIYTGNLLIGLFHFCVNSILRVTVGAKLAVKADSLRIPGREGKGV